MIKPDGPAEIARHPRGQPVCRTVTITTRLIIRLGPAAARDRRPMAGTPLRRAFLAIGDGAAERLVTAAGTARIRTQKATAITLAKLHGVVVADRALGVAALSGRFAEEDPTGSWWTTSVQDLSAGLQADHQVDHRSVSANNTVCNRHGQLDRFRHLEPTPTTRSAPRSTTSGSTIRFEGDPLMSRPDTARKGGTSRASSASVAVGPGIDAGVASARVAEEVLALTRRLRMPYLRKAAEDVIPTDRAQRWDPAEPLRSC